MSSAAGGWSRRTLSCTRYRMAEDTPGRLGLPNSEGERATPRMWPASFGAAEARVELDDDSVRRIVCDAITPALRDHGLARIQLLPTAVDRIPIPSLER